MTAFQAYRDFTAVKQHFTRLDYDYEKYLGKVKVDPVKFEVMPARGFFEKASKKPDPHGLFVSNLSHDPAAWIGEVVSDVGLARYAAWRRRCEALTYHVRSQLPVLKRNFNDNFLIERGRHPNLLTLYLAGSVSLETATVLTSLTKCLGAWDESMAGDPTWSQLGLVMRKYPTFLKFNRDKMVSTIMEEFS